MKLYNKTRYPDELLEQILAEAGKTVHARTTGVIVVTTSSKPGYNHTKGIAQNCTWVKRFALDARAYRKGTHELKTGMVQTDGGWIRLTIPYPFVPQWIKGSNVYPAWSKAHDFDGLNIAENIFDVATHEWQHIKQYQEDKFNFRSKVEREKHHDNRIWEKDAIKASNKARSKPRSTSQESILNLALWIEANKAI